MNSVSSPTFPALQESLVGTGRQAFRHSLSQHARLISIETPLASDVLIVQNVSGREAMSELFRFEVDCL
ncbi:MAG TPA: hypothetical protein VJ652_03520, partial [Noviherbaspirillum sp.]|nr:hypothetical protein [Noviherbaspirillum sp.]